MLTAADKTHEIIDSLINNQEINDLVQSMGKSAAKLVSIVGPLAIEAEKRETWQKATPKNNGQQYAKFEVDEPPILDDGSNPSPPSTQQLNYQDLILDHQNKTGKTIQPVRSKHGYRIEYNGCCPDCGAPREFLYDNNIPNGQLLCKVCNSTFTVQKTHLDKIILRCPHCKKALNLHHDRNGYNVYYCRNDDCNYRINRIHTLKNRGISTKELKTGKFKTRYYTRIFDINYEDLKKHGFLTDGIQSKLMNINNSQLVLGLVLTYYVNYALSSRKVAAIMKDIHEVDISKQTVLNYATYTAKIIEPYLENYQYDLSNIICGDETYVKIKGKNAYVFFFSDSEKKIITSYMIFENRDTLAAIKSLYQTFKKYKEIPKDLQVITDGNPIYKAAQVFFNLENINFDLFQVIGLHNKDKISSEFRPHKQITERLNRTYKSFYSQSNGFSNLISANIYMILFSACFNFLRPHSGIDYRVPVEVEEIQEQSNMQSKWLKLIEFGINAA